ncbi:GFA family protein [Leisingera caerulea]|uniref:GFA family protein n=1 Tax=Leisingera caerulea TaxID=506591 RepID=UPI0021A93DAF|nr:GFA family protein [Leisingera caerulea]UWQ82674.1 GFA family protein [Leisingera caerulea]
MDTFQLQIEGACLCGQVQVRVTAPPLLTLACHCRDCQKLCASAYSLTAMFPAEAFAVTGELVTGGRRTERRQHNFCPKCLNFLFSRIQGAESRVNLRTTVFDNPAWSEPFVELMTEEKLSWSHVPATHSFARFPETAAELEALMADYSKRRGL